jgi:hypothetical protein
MKTMFGRDAPPAGASFVAAIAARKSLRRIVF